MARLSARFEGDPPPPPLPSAGNVANVYRGGLVPIIYVIVGAFVAAAHHYYRHTGTVRGVGSALLAIFLWPLLLLGTDLHIH
jgi:hypothetical protein